jgi:hypothetical protein
MPDIVKVYYVCLAVGILLAIVLAPYLHFSDFLKP